MYFCGQCKKRSNDLNQLLFVDDNSTVGFCSEECIEVFYNPLVEHYETLDKKLRETLALKNENCRKYVGVPEYMDGLVKDPDEIWVIENDLKQCLYSFIKNYKTAEGEAFSICALCLVFNYQASFVFLASATQNILYKDSFKIGKAMENPKSFLAKSQVAQQEINIDPETLELLENKKSICLANLMTNRSDEDIPLEKFHDYEPFFQKTMENPDEIYSSFDNANDEILTYIMAHERNHQSFFYFILFLVTKPNEQKVKNKFLPIISFPSSDGEVYKEYKVGTAIKVRDQF